MTPMATNNDPRRSDDNDSFTDESPVEETHIMQESSSEQGIVDHSTGADGADGADDARNLALPVRCSITLHNPLRRRSRYRRRRRNGRRRAGYERRIKKLKKQLHALYVELYTLMECNRMLREILLEPVQPNQHSYDGMATISTCADRTTSTDIISSNPFVTSTLTIGCSPIELLAYRLALFGMLRYGSAASPQTNIV